MVYLLSIHIINATIGYEAMDSQDQATKTIIIKFTLAGVILALLLPISATLLELIIHRPPLLSQLLNGHKLTNRCF